MKEIEVDDAIRADQALFEDVQRATKLLEEQIGASASKVTADWKLLDSPGERKLELAITDQEDHAKAVYSRDLLSRMSIDRFRILLIRLWGDLLQAKSNRQIANLMQLVHTLEED